jgi:hypothetical protein
VPDEDGRHCNVSTTGEECGPTLAPFVWENGTMVNLDTLGGTFGLPIWLNNREEVIAGSNWRETRPLTASCGAAAS